MAAVSLEELSKAYRTRHGVVRAVRELSLQVADGELVVLVGPSGCGKTTTLRLIAGLERATAGTIRIGGHVVNDVDPRDRDVAMVGQNFALYPHMNVFRNLAFGLRMRGVARAEIRRLVHVAAEQLGMTDSLDRRPHQLSGGERQRVALGRAIVRRPQVFLLDEPLSNLDAQLRVQLRTEIKRLQRELGTTMVYVTHDQAEAMALGDSLAVMHEGELRQCGPPTDVYERPENRFVAGFIGTPRMNFFRGRIARHNDGVRFEGAAFNIEVHRLTLDCKADREVVLGIRPEHVRIRGRPEDSTGESGCSLIDVGKGRVALVEPLGDTAHIHLTLADDTRLTVRAPAADAVRPGTEVRVLADASRIHFFDADASGGRIEEK